MHAAMGAATVARLGVFQTYGAAMSEAEITDEAAQAAKDALECAIRDYYQIIEPDVMVTGWVMVTHKVSDAMDREGVSSVGTLTPTGQVFPLTRGLLDIALEGDRNLLS